MLEFQLFRIKVHPQKQLNLYTLKKNRPEILQETILSNPSPEKQWHIGNVSLFDQSGLYCRVGKTSKSTLAIYKEEEHYFLDQEFETAPYTHVIVDITFELCAIARKTQLAQKTSGIAKHFIRLLNNSTKAHELQANFEIDDLKDPDDFISQLVNAYSVSKFWVCFSRPNAFDANEDFVKPSQKMLEASGGEKGKTELQGSSLNPEMLEAVARSSAATGNDAGALIKVSEGAKAIRKYLKGNPVVISQDDIADDTQKKILFSRIKERYRQIRGDADK